MKIIKRNGEEAVFDISKIITAISKANNEVPASEKLTEKQISDIANEITTYCENSKTEMNVENIDLSTIESEYPNKKICGNYKIKLLLDGQEYNPQKYEQKLNIEINLSENKEYTILEYKNEKLSKYEKAEVGKDKITIATTEINSYLVYEKDTLQKCSIHVPVKSLNLYDGMTLLLF